MLKITTPASLPRITAAESLSVLLAVGGPLIAKGVIIRRPPVVRLLQATGAEKTGIRMLQDLRRRYGDGPVMMRLPMREQAILLSPQSVRRVLEQTPDPFETDSSEKHAALSHFEPRGSLVSRGEDRSVRRGLNEHVLGAGCPVHRLADRFQTIVQEECAVLLSPSLSWGAFKDGWFRIVRRCLFGDAARDDTGLTAIAARLRGDANWAFMKPRRAVLRAQFLSRIASYVHTAEDATLAAMARHAATARAAPEDQIGQWLFAFDAAGIATFRTLAIFASNAEVRAQAQRDEGPAFPFLRTALLEAIRLWPTTPAILRQTSRDTDWDGATMKQGTGVLIHVPFFHRDEERLPFANRFAPAVWLEGDAATWPLIPFSGGPAECPAKDLVLMIAGMTLSALVRWGDYRVPEDKALDLAHLPATFDHVALALSCGDGEGCSQ